MARRPGSAPYHLGLTRDQVIGEALALTHETHLLGWTLRGLAERVGAQVSVITHHAGSKDQLLHRVVAAALADLRPPPDDAPWDDWFRAMLDEIRGPLRRYPGTAKWVLLHGPTFASVMPMIDAGIATLQAAGFGDRTGMAFATLFNNATMTIAMADERLLADRDGSSDHAAMMERLRRTGQGSPGMAVLDRTLMASFASGGPDAGRAQAAYDEFVLETTIAGLRTWLD